MTNVTSIVRSCLSVLATAALLLGLGLAGAQAAFFERAKANGAATRGAYVSG